MLVIMTLEDPTLLWPFAFDPTPSVMTNLSQPPVTPAAASCPAGADAQHPNDVFGRLFRACEGLPAVRCAVVHPCDADSLGGAMAAAQRGLIEPVLVGPQAKIRAVAKEGGWDLSPWRIVDTEHSHAAADAAVALARAGEVQALMKGSLPYLFNAGCVQVAEVFRQRSKAGRCGVGCGGVRLGIARSGLRCRR